jgi:histidyl-tRNA synthetase
VKGTLLPNFSRCKTNIIFRLQKGAELRILDSKDPQDIGVIESSSCPLLLDYLTEKSKKRFQDVCRLLEAVGVPFKVNPRLVRGLDYYGETVFEFLDESNRLGRQQGTVLAGGSYAHLIKTFGGPSLAGVGWAAGVERLAMLIDPKLVPPSPRPVVMVMVWDAEDKEQQHATIPLLSPLSVEREETAALASYAFQVGLKLREEGYVVLQHSGAEGSLPKQLKRANKHNAWAAVFVGEKERAQGKVTIKLLDSGQQETIEPAQLTQILGKQCPAYLGSHVE